MYDQRTHKFTTMDDLYKLTYSGITFKVIEVSTKRDITREVMLELLINNKTLTTEAVRKLIMYDNDRLNIKSSAHIKNLMNSLIN